MVTISALVQFIPLGAEAPMQAVDQAIAIIQQSNLAHEVGPFGTSIEGPIEAVEELIAALLRTSHTEEYLLNVQYHIGEERLSNLQKVAKFR